jgi:DNA repair exonuclease SbcCD ATPase subunit
MENKPVNEHEKIFINHTRTQIKNDLRESKKAIKTGSLASIRESHNRLVSQLDVVGDTSTFASEAQSLREHIDTLNEMLQEKAQITQAKLVATNQKNISLTEKYENTKKVLGKLKEDHSKANRVIKLLSENEKVMKSDIGMAVQDMRAMKSDIHNLVEDRKAMSGDITRLMAEKVTLLKDIDRLLEDRSVMASDIKKLVEDTKLRDKDISWLTEKVKKLKASSARKSPTKKMRKEMMGSDIDYEDNLDVYETELSYPGLDNEPSVYEDGDDIFDGPYGTAVDDAIAYRIEDEDEGIDFSSMGYEESRKVQKSNRFKKQPIQRKRLGESKKVNKVKRPVGRDIREFIEQEIQKKPALKRVKDKLLQSTSLIEAVRKVDAFTSKLDDTPIRLSESFTASYNDDWLGERK